MLSAELASLHEQACLLKQLVHHGVHHLAALCESLAYPRSQSSREFHHETSIFRCCDE